MANWYVLGLLLRNNGALVEGAGALDGPRDDANDLTKTLAFPEVILLNDIFVFCKGPNKQKR